MNSSGTAPSTIWLSNTKPEPGARREPQFDARELPPPALSFLCVVDLGRATQALAIGHLWRADVGLDPIGEPQDPDRLVQLYFADARDDRLAGLKIGEGLKIDVPRDQIGERRA